MRQLTILAVSFWGYFCQAQQTGTIRMLVDPGHNFEFVVDKKHRMQQREIKLTEGLHHFSVWAPERVIMDTNVFVVADRTSELVMQLPYSPEYVAYRKELGSYQTRKRVARTLPMVAVAGGLVWTGIAIGNYGKAKNVLKDDRKTYSIDVDPASIRALKENVIPLHNEELRAARNNVYLASGFTVLSAAISYYIFNKSANWVRPAFDDKQKILFDGLAWVPSATGGSILAGISIPLAR